MKISRRLPLPALAVLLFIGAIQGKDTEPTPVQMETGADRPLFEVDTDFRLRFEGDYEGLREDGSARPDRSRLRLRARLALEYRPHSRVRIRGRLRTGSVSSQQGANIDLWDFSGNPTGEKHLIPDQYFVAFENEGTELWAGRDVLPLWRARGVLWDNDATALGVAAAQRFVPAQDQEISLRGGYFVPPDGGLEFHGELLLGQLRWGLRTDQWGFSTATAFLGLWGEEGAENLRNGNGRRDYRLLNQAFELRFLLRSLPVAFTGNWTENLQDYSPFAANEFTASHFDETTAFDIGIALGDLGARGDWRVEYQYAHVGALGLNASYADDDWFASGARGQFDASDYRGHDFQVGYSFAPDLWMAARFFTVQGIASDLENRRLRVDLNYRWGTEEP